MNGRNAWKFSSLKGTKRPADVVRKLMRSIHNRQTNTWLRAYWFNLSNRSHKASPGDRKIRTTIIFIIEEFFRQNPDILLYMCDSADEQQAMRSRLFLRWFNAYGQQADYYSRTEMILDEDEENYIALIVKRSHPRLQDIIAFFDEQVMMFRANKPWLSPLHPWLFPLKRAKSDEKVRLLRYLCAESKT